MDDPTIDPMVSQAYREIKAAVDYNNNVKNTKKIRNKRKTKPSPATTAASATPSPQIPSLSTSSATTTSRLSSSQPATTSRATTSRTTPSSASQPNNEPFFDNDGDEFFASLPKRNQEPARKDGSQEELFSSDPDSDDDWLK